MNKIIEINDLQHSIQIIGLKDFREAGRNKTISKALCFDDFNNIETGNSFRENAFLKADYIHRLTKQPCLAEDSGLCIDALNGLPGIYSARYGDSQSQMKLQMSDQDRCQVLINDINALKLSAQKRSARFVCVVALHYAKQCVYFCGSCEGRVTTRCYGDSGFGYDPIFLSKDYGYRKTFAQLSRKQKNSVSHRHRAWQMCLDYIAKNKIPQNL